jgi:hypothetical protein
MWLCDKALDYLRDMSETKSDPLYNLAKTYKTFRYSAIDLAEKYIPLQQRASEEETFLHKQEDQNLAAVPEWFDNWDGIEKLPIAIN